MTVVRKVTMLPVSGGAELFAEFERPRSANSVLVICHGICEHSGRYARFADYLSGRGIASVRFDLRGHGRSTGLRGHIERFDTYVEDFQQVHRWAVAQCLREGGPLPTFLLGHSMGGVVVSRYLQQYGSDECSGLVLSAPGYLASVEIPRYKRVLLGLLLPWFPRLRLPTGITSDELTTDCDERRRYREDAQIGSRVSLKWYVEFTRAGQTALDNAAAVALPIYALCGTEDRVISPNAVQEFVEKAQATDKQLRLWEGLRHETLNERLPERIDVAQSIAEWIEARSKTV